MTGNEDHPAWEVKGHTRQPNGTLSFELASPMGPIWDVHITGAGQWTFALRRITQPQPYQQSEMVSAVTEYVLAHPQALEDAR